MIPSAETIGDFDGRKYVVCRAMLQEPALSLYYKYARKQASAGRMDPGDEQVPNTPNAYGDLFMDGLLNDLVPLVQHATGRMVFPTYSYLRVYKTGDVLVRHSDRAACEISVTLCLGYDASGPGRFGSRDHKASQALSWNPATAWCIAGSSARIGAMRSKANTRRRYFSTTSIELVPMRVEDLTNVLV